MRCGFSSRAEPGSSARARDEHSPAVDELVIRFRDARETLADTLRWLWRAGHRDRRCVVRPATD
jgi:hypothetical protein